MRENPMHRSKTSLSLSQPQPLLTSTSKKKKKKTLQEEWRGRVAPVSWSPRAFVYEGLLTDAECDHLIALATPTMANSTVVDNETGESFASDVRTSTGTFLEPGADAIVSRIERRVSLITNLPRANQEGRLLLAFLFFSFFKRGWKMKERGWKTKEKKKTLTKFFF
jgi:prolyl 4-hydroxylase